MPFKSEKQRRYLYARHPEIARRWSAEEKSVRKSQPSFGGGGTMGRRMTSEQLSDDVEKGLREVGHGVRRVARETTDELKETFKPFGVGETYRASVRGVHPAQVRAAETIIRRPKAAAAVGTGAYLGSYNLGNFAGNQRGKRKGRLEVAKRHRDYNPEHRRQRRIGAAEATLLGAGGTAAGFGGRGVVRDTKKLRALPIASPGRSGVANVGQSAAGRGVLVLSRRNAGLLGGGALALSSAAGLRRWAEGNRGRSYD